MPGVLNSNFNIGLNREVGKMANSSNLSMDFQDSSLNDFANSFFGFNDMESDCELPDDETPMDLVSYLAQEETGANDKSLDLLLTQWEGESYSHSDSYDKVTSGQDPFMGMSHQESTSPTSKNTLLSQMMNSFDYDEQQQQQQKQHTQGFVAWGHRSLTIKEEKDDYIEDIDELTKSSFSHLASSAYLEDDDVDLPGFVDTPSPSSQSGTATGDDSDVDIETIPEAPRAADSCGDFTRDSSPSSRAGSPVTTLHGLGGNNLLSILTKSPVGGPLSPPSSSSACSSASSSPRPSPTVHFNTYGVSSSASLAENLMKGRTSLLGQKRKSPKEKRSHHHHHHHNHHQLENRISSTSQQSSYPHVLCTSNSINFHDYAMSPLSPESSPTCYVPSTSSCTETGVPTVSQSKRVYKRKHLPLDATDKEKQHHHNQLERNRRQKLADLFIDLRDEVPKISTQSKASKVMILNEATMYIHELQRLEETQEKDISIELRRKEALSRQLRHLKSQLGGIRVG